MNTSLFAASMLWFGIGGNLLSRAEAQGYPFWLTAAGAASFMLAIVSFAWGMRNSIKERRKWRQLNASVRYLEKLRPR